MVFVFLKLKLIQITHPLKSFIFVQSNSFFPYFQITVDSPVTEIVSRDMAEEECTLLQCEHARFGLSLTKLGDINKDGYNGENGS